MPLGAFGLFSKDVLVFRFCGILIPSSRDSFSPALAGCCLEIYVLESILIIHERGDIARISVLTKNFLRV